MAELARRNIALISTPEGQCPVLSADGRCTQYADRPMICRLWGATPDMPCPHGCTVVGGYLPAERSRELLERAHAL